MSESNVLAKFHANENEEPTMIQAKRVRQLYEAGEYLVDVECCLEQALEQAALILFCDPLSASTGRAASVLLKLAPIMSETPYNFMEVTYNESLFGPTTQPRPDAVRLALATNENMTWEEFEQKLVPYITNTLADVEESDIVRNQAEQLVRTGIVNDATTFGELPAILAAQK